MMLSPRTLSLRNQNRSILHAVDQSIRNTNRGRINDGDYCKGKYAANQFVEIDNCNLSSQKSFNIERTMEDNNTQNCRTNLDGEYKPIVDHNLNRNSKYVQNITSAKNSPISSTDDLRAVVREIISEMDVNIKNSGEQRCSQTQDLTRRTVSQPNLKTHRRKSVSLNQQRAADLQMHARTHSHLTSKCYCTHQNNNRVKPDSKYLIQVFSQKQHIPSRLKKQRYRADVVTKSPRVVRWADFDEECKETNFYLSEDELTPRSKEPSLVSQPESPRSWSSRLSTYPKHNERELSLIDKVKVFRESHWSDCHASPDMKPSPFNHECVRHYRLNERLFLEPMFTNQEGESECPVCPTNKSNLTATQQEPPNEMESLRKKSGHIVITLPVAALEPSDLSRPPKCERDRRKEKSCYSVGHHILTAQKYLFSCPRDSVALRYQKFDY